MTLQMGNPDLNSAADVARIVFVNTKADLDCWRRDDGLEILYTENGYTLSISDRDDYKTGDGVTYWFSKDDGEDFHTDGWEATAPAEAVEAEIMRVIHYLDHLAEAGRE